MMKKILLAIGLGILPAAAAFAQSLPTISGTAMTPDEADFVARGAASVKQMAAPLPGAFAPGDWIKVGGSWGPSSAWQVGLDKSATVGACAFLGMAKGQAPKYILGPCRDVVLLAKNGVQVYHLGFEALGYDVADLSHSHPYYLGRFGFNVGPAASAFLASVSARVPYVENLLNWTAPAPLQYLGDITTVDSGGGPGVGVKPVWGVGIKLNVPLDDLWTLIKGAPAK